MLVRLSQPLLTRRYRDIAADRLDARSSCLPDQTIRDLKTELKRPHHPFWLSCRIDEPILFFLHTRFSNYGAPAEGTSRRPL